MQSLTLSFRRLYATTPLPDLARIARTESTPHAVRLRRLRDKPLKEPLASAVDEAGLTPSDARRYQRQLALGEVRQRNGRFESASSWGTRKIARRTRIRGVVTTELPGGQTREDVVGQTVYLPNIIFRLVRNHTPAGTAYNPYEATFRIPQSVTKTDVRAYLSAIYGVETTYIRTDNYLSPIARARDASWTRTRSYRTYKRAVVGLVEPFYYPLALEDMPGPAREERTKWLESKFMIEGMKMLQKMEMLRMTQKGSKDWKWRHGVTHQRGTILKNILERRASREGYLAQTVEKMREARSAGTPVLVTAPQVLM